MGRIIISENISLDGVAQDPTGDEGFERGGWAGRIEETDREAWAQALLEEARSAQALLLGRRSDAWFASRWLTRSGEWADRLNGLPKFVVSSTITEPKWSNATVLTGEVLRKISDLKRKIDGDIVVYASIQLAQALMEHNLADELRLMIYPVVLGSGRRLFDETKDQKSMRLVHARTVGKSLVLLTYERI